MTISVFTTISLNNILQNLLRKDLSSKPGFSIQGIMRKRHSVWFALISKENVTDQHCFRRNFLNPSWNYIWPTFFFSWISKKLCGMLHYSSLRFTVFVRLQSVHMLRCTFTCCFAHLISDVQFHLFNSVSRFLYRIFT